MNPVIMVHGGAKPIPPEDAPAMRAGCLRAAARGWSEPDAGGSALDAVEAAVRELESDPAFNAGYGSTLNPDGVVRMDAGLMNGPDLQAGAVAIVEGIRHPISVARAVLGEPEVLIASHHARDFAREKGQEMCPPEALISPSQREKWASEQREKQKPAPTNDTVGAVALDRDGNLAAGASTGGTGDKRPGRVGDSAQIGSGFYADNGRGACAVTGEGEAIAKIGVALAAVEVPRTDPRAEPDEIGHAVLDTMEQRAGGKAGLLLVTPDGRIGWWHNEENMAVAYRTAGMDGPMAFVHKDEERRASSKSEG